MISCCKLCMNRWAPGKCRTMSLSEAEILLSLIISESSLAARIHRLGNGREWVIIVKEQYFVWSEKDWTSHKWTWTYELFPMEEVDEGSTETELRLPELVI